MRLHLEFAIRWLFLLILQGSVNTSKDMCSSTTYSSDENSLGLTIADIDIIPRNCSCEMTDLATLTCSFYTCWTCISEITCASLSCPCVKVDSLTISSTCISTSVTSINCLSVSDETYMYSCPISTKYRLSFSTNPVIYSCNAERNKKRDLVITIQPIAIVNRNNTSDNERSDHGFKEEDCTAITTTPNASSRPTTPETSISARSTTTAKIEYQSRVESTPKFETAGRSSSTLMSGSMIMNVTTVTEPPPKPSMMTYDSAKNIDIGVGVGVGLGGGILLIIAIIIVILIFRRRRAESLKLRANDTTQPTAVAAAAAAPSESSYESYRVPVIAPYDNATNGVTASGYQTITYDSEPVGESNDGYTEIREPEEASNHNGYADCRIGRNEVYSMYHEMGQDHDNISETPSMSIENETTVIDNDLYGQ